MHPKASGPSPPLLMHAGSAPAPSPSHDLSPHRPTSFLASLPVTAAPPSSLASPPFKPSLLFAASCGLAPVSPFALVPFSPFPTCPIEGDPADSPKQHRRSVSRSAVDAPANPEERGQVLTCADHGTMPSRTQEVFQQPTNVATDGQDDDLALSNEDFDINDGSSEVSDQWGRSPSAFYPRRNDPCSAVSTHLLEDTTLATSFGLLPGPTLLGSSSSSARSLHEENDVAAILEPAAKPPAFSDRSLSGRSLPGTTDAAAVREPSPIVVRSSPSTPTVSPAPPPLPETALNLARIDDGYTLGQSFVSPHIRRSKRIPNRPGPVSTEERYHLAASIRSLESKPTTRHHTATDESSDPRSPSMTEQEILFVSTASGFVIPPANKEVVLEFIKARGNSRP